MPLQQLKCAWVYRCEVGFAVLQQLQTSSVALGCNVWLNKRWRRCNFGKRTAQTAPAAQALRVANDWLHTFQLGNTHCWKCFTNHDHCAVPATFVADPRPSWCAKHVDVFMQVLYEWQPARLAQQRVVVTPVAHQFGMHRTVWLVQHCVLAKALQCGNDGRDDKPGGFVNFRKVVHRQRNAALRHQSAATNLAFANTERTRSAKCSRGRVS